MMKSKDVIKQELHQKFADALADSDPEKISEAMAEFALGVQEDILRDYRDFQGSQDAAILAARGVHQLTQTENKFFGGIIASLKNSPTMAFTGIDATTLPETTFDEVMNDIKTSFPLLAVIKPMTTNAITKMLVNKQGMQLGGWGALGSKITAELSGAIGVVDISLCKASAFIPVSRDFIDAGPTWMEAYVRAILVESLGYTLCQGIVAGTGKDMPIGMLKDPDGSVTNGVYPDKTPITITDFSPLTIGGIAATLASGPNNRQRAVPNILCVTNPVDYFQKVMPATTYMTPNGGYVNNIMPYPSTIVQDLNVPSGKCIFGLADRYFLGVGMGGETGQLEYSDEYQFVDDNRVYKLRMLANGAPRDKNAFVVADISGLTPLTVTVNVGTVAGTVKTKEQTA